MSAVSAPLCIYVRVSRRSDDEGKQRSPEDQITRATKFALDSGFQVGPVYPDLGVSGAVHPLERPGMRKVLDAIESGRAGGVVAFDMSRLSREPSHLEFLATWMLERHAAMLWYGMPTDPHSPIGALQIGLVAQIDKYQRMVAGERFSLAADAAVKQGIPHGVTPFGYRQLEDRTIEPDPETAPIVQELFERRAIGDGWGTLAMWLTEKTGRTWSRRGISHMVRRELYMTGRLSIDDVTSEVDSGAIVEAALWHAAQSPKRVKDGRTAKARAPLAGLLRCAACGHTLIRSVPSPGQGKRTARYRCTAIHCTDRANIPAPVIEARVVQESFAQDLRLQVRPQETPDLSALETELTAAERRLAHTLEPAMQDDLGEDWAPTVRQRRESRDAAAAALGVARAEAGLTDGGSVQQLALGHVWPDLEPLQQREAISWLWEAVKVRKVPRGSDPDLEFVPRATRPVGAVLEMRPPALEVTWPGMDAGA